ncbi:acyl-CoA dehydrogenase family protein [Nocardia jejuensis]|uniref:acyl-CoA dehydrogenase family protein n=1 Tax=Nocardia jejuensis TaxID=328049 RepID=UPI000A77363A|nr:acyl-CoA dehydrogenase family protein [Nocardia jejuensis]
MADFDTAPDELDLLEQTVRKTMLTVAAGAELDRALAELGWTDMLTDIPNLAIPLVFRLLGETGSHAPLLNDVILHTAGADPLGTTPLPFTGGAWLEWERTDRAGTTVDEQLPLHPVRLIGPASTGTDRAGGPSPDALHGFATTDPLDAREVTPGPLANGHGTDAHRSARHEALAAGRRALAWWLVGSSRAMLGLARRHALEREQFGRPVAAFQAVRHRLAEALIAIEGAEATLTVAGDDLGALLAKAAAGRAAQITARHCQQVLGGIGFTAEHDLHRHVRRTLVLDGLLGSTRELVREAGVLIRTEGAAPRLAQL